MMWRLTNLFRSGQQQTLSPSALSAIHTAIEKSGDALRCKQPLVIIGSSVSASSSPEMVEAALSKAGVRAEVRPIPGTRRMQVTFASQDEVEKVRASRNGHSSNTQ